jgi:hypothetical protein
MERRQRYLTMQIAYTEAVGRLAFDEERRLIELQLGLALAL